MFGSSPKSLSHPRTGHTSGLGAIRLLTPKAPTSLRHGWCPGPTQAGSTPDPQGKKGGQKDNAGSPAAPKDRWRLRATHPTLQPGLVPSSNNATALTNRQRGRLGGPALREPALTPGGAGGLQSLGSRSAPVKRSALIPEHLGC